jgi:hypothetical protein
MSTDIKITMAVMNPVVSPVVTLDATRARDIDTPR